jgi:hypothetical protein
MRLRLVAHNVINEALSGLSHQKVFALSNEPPLVTSNLIDANFADGNFIDTVEVTGIGFNSAKRRKGLFHFHTFIMARIGAEVKGS